MGKANCWEFKKCGCEPGGENVMELGVCPASTERTVDGINGGTNGGRACWAIVGTLCKGTVQDSIAAKLHNCVGCEFRESVELDEGANLRTPSMIADLTR
ncbi:MAG: hypothetical protein FDZ70_07420 [Actinobacteria bacterium]|nr:MAG: hypothetical protein FDZ70_07420 [Actinomycetota bacterium]